MKKPKIEERRDMKLSTKLPFGKYKGDTVLNVFYDHNDQQYMRWFAYKVWNGTISDEVSEWLRAE